MSQVSSHELFLIEAKKKALAYAEWKKDSDLITAEILAIPRYDDIPSYRICPFKAPMHEQNLNAAGKCNNCFDSLCSGVVAVTCGTACGCNWTICVKCMTDWVENGFESDSHEDVSEEVSHKEVSEEVSYEEVSEEVVQHIEEQDELSEPEDDVVNKLIEGVVLQLEPCS